MNLVMFPLALAPSPKRCAALGSADGVVGKLASDCRRSWLLNGFFVAAEFALVKVRTAISTPWPLAAGNVRAGFVKQRFKDNLNAYLSACQVGITMASLGLGWLGEPFLARMLQPFFAVWQESNLPR